MNRKTFLSSLSAILLAPFIGKSKEKEHIIRPEWVKANPALIDVSQINGARPLKVMIKGGVNAGGYSSERNGLVAIDAGNALVNLSGKLTVSGKDLIMVLNRKR
jgi:hypothetical protein